MSAFLGPIHYWLYYKIELQDKMTDVLLALNEECGYVTDLRKFVDAQYGILEKKALEEMIDESNIHGWLQQKVSMVEGRFAYVLTKMLNANEEALTKAKQRLYDFGSAVYEENGKNYDSAEQIYQQFNDMLLDGMPCDQTNELISVSADQVVYRRSSCIHEIFWTQVEGSVQNYYALRKQFICGFLCETVFSFEEDKNGYYYIKRK